MAVTSNDFINDVKLFLRMNTSVTAYDEEINGLIDSAISSLVVAGVSVVKKTPLIAEYVKTYVRRRMLQDTSTAFQNSEESREMHIIQQLTYGNGGDENV
nr:MAG TPA: hypothetical protein [Caudoviricetes sp.]